MERLEMARDYLPVKVRVEAKPKLKIQPQETMDLCSARFSNPIKTEDEGDLTLVSGAGRDRRRFCQPLP